MRQQEGRLGQGVIIPAEPEEGPTSDMVRSLPFMLYIQFASYIKIIEKYLSD